MQVLRPGGMLMTCSCSGAVALDDHFLPVLKVTNLPDNKHVLRSQSFIACGSHPFYYIMLRHTALHFASLWMQESV